MEDHGDPIDTAGDVVFASVNTEKVTECSVSIGYIMFIDTELEAGDTC